MDTSIFKAYDVRGVVPTQLNEEAAARIAAGVLAVTGGQRFVVGGDVRLHSRSLVEAMIEMLVAAGVDVLDVGLCGTEEVYFWTGYTQADAGLMVTASHNPAEYNGVKFVGKSAEPLSKEGMEGVRDWAGSNAPLPRATTPGTVSPVEDRRPYIDRLMGFVDLGRTRPLHIVLNSGNGCAGPIVEALAARMPAHIKLTSVHAEPDGTFPNGIPNPLLPEKRQSTTDAVVAHGADFGVAFDGDFDRCFFFDGAGNFIEGYYVVGLLARAMLQGAADGTAIVYDNRMTWATLAAIEEAKGRAVVSRTGHIFLKRLVRENAAPYGGEMSAHHYFHDFFSCDSGMIPWLLMAQLVGASDQSLGDLVADAQQAFPCSGEINFRVDDAGAVLDRMRAAFDGQGERIEIDGLTYEFDDWRFNVRSSNTEPLLRLNVETRGDRALLDRQTEALKALIQG
ncbi:MAG: phosphomannomutase [Geminicoccus sp.]|nr:phosphomannomutase [Geminicoccus sp.]